jgi:predicted ATPase
MEETLEKWLFYDGTQINVDGIRRANTELGSGDRVLSPSGDNLTLVILNLWQDGLEFQERLNHAMKELFPRTRQLRYIVNRTNVTLEWYVEGIDRPFYLDEMSDGTIRMLCWAVVLFGRPKVKNAVDVRRLIVIDEPETSLHPAWLAILAGWIREAARESQVIVSTHSSDLLDYFTDDLDSVRVFGDDPEHPGYVTIRPLDQEAIKPKLEEGWKLSDLYRVGAPEIGGWPW